MIVDHAAFVSHHHIVGQQVLPVQRGGGAFDRTIWTITPLRAVDALEVGTNAFTCDTTWNQPPAVAHQRQCAGRSCAA